MAAYIRRSFLLVTCMALMIGSSVGTSSAHAALPPFSTTKTLTGPYLFGPSTLSEFDHFVAAYPNYADHLQITFYSNGTCLVMDTLSLDSMTGSYTRLNNNRIDINMVLPPGGYFTTAKYKLYKQSGSNWYGEMYFDNILYGFLRGNLN